MKFNEFENLVRCSFERRLKIAKSKNHDYAAETDVLQNFKNMAVALGRLQIDVSQPYGVALIYALLKIDRLNNLLRRGVGPNNESLQDTIDDLKNYIDLMEACITEPLMGEIDKSVESTKALYHLRGDKSEG